MVPRPRRGAHGRDLHQGQPPTALAARFSAIAEAEVAEVAAMTARARCAVEVGCAGVPSEVQGARWRLTSGE